MEGAEGFSVANHISHLQMYKDKREEKIVSMKLKGMLAVRIGKELGVSRERVRQILLAYCIREDKNPESFRIVKPSHWDEVIAERDSYKLNGSCIVKRNIPRVTFHSSRIVSAKIEPDRCFSCRANVNLRFYGLISFCAECYERYFVRRTGTELQGMDRTREVVRIRDSHKCQDCGHKWNDGERRLDVHHLNGLCGKLTYRYDKIEDIDGLVTLCHRCHMNQEEVVEKMVSKSGNVRRFFPNKIESRNIHIISG